MSLKQKTLSGLLWSFVDDFAKLSITFISGIILARLLSPREFGLIGMTTVFIAISQSFVDSGFKQALIRKQDCTQVDFSTVFYFNLLISVIFYLLLLLFADNVSRFFDEPQLEQIIKVLGLSLIINALSLVQQTRLTKDINFKLQTRISIISSFVSGAVGVYMAFSGYGVWSLVFSTLVRLLVILLLLWMWNDWLPSMVFSWDSFREMFSFGSKLLISGLINTIYTNIYNLVIGKYFSAADLGYFNRANEFQRLPSQHLTGVIQRVSYPVLATLQNDTAQLKAAYRKLIQSTMLITFVLMLGLAAIAEPMVIVLVGEQWRPSIIYLQLLCFVGMFYPLHAINLNMLQVQGRSDLFLRLEVIKKVFAVPIIVLGITYGIKTLIVAMFLNTLIAYYLNSYWSGKFIGYSFLRQVKDLVPSLIMAACMAFVVYFLGLIERSYLFKLVLQVTVGGILTIGLGELLRIEGYIYIKESLLEKVIPFFKPHKRTM